MAEDVRKTVAFLVTYVEEIVSLQKPTLAAVLKSNRANQVKGWKAAKNFWERKRQTLTVEQQPWASPIDSNQYSQTKINNFY